MVYLATKMEQAVFAWEFVYRKYLEAGLIPPNDFGVHIMPMAIHPKVAILVSDLATATIYPWRTPCECAFEGEVAEIRNDGRTVVEVGSLASDSLSALMDVFRHAYHYARKIGATDILCEAKESQAIVYQRVFGFKLISERNECRFVGGADAFGLRLRLDIAEIDLSRKGIKAFWKTPLPVFPDARLILDWKSIEGTVADRYFRSGVSFCETCEENDKCFY